MTESWLSPTNKVLWMKAFRKRATEVTLRDGRVFLISYHSNPDRAKFRPKRGFIPTGEFLLKQVTNKNWLAQVERIHGTPGPNKGESPYVTMMKEFVMARSLKGVDVAEQWPPLVGKQTSTLRNAFMRARTELGKAARKVEVINRQGRVYLIKDGG